MSHHQRDPNLTTCVEAVMAGSKLPTPDRIRQLVQFDPETTTFTHLPRVPSDFPEGPRQEVQCRIWNTRYAGKPALASKDKHGYLVGCMDNYPVKTHRVLWAYIHGAWPDGDLDHINGDKADNRLENLRVVTHAENMRNMRMPSTNTSGHVGIYKDPIANSYIVKIGKRLHVGRWPTMEEALAARHAALKVLNYHENHGKPIAR